MKNSQSSLFSRIESEIKSYLSDTVEVSPGVQYSQHKTIERIYKFRNRDLSEGNKLNEDLSYNYYYDIISPRVDSEVKNLRIDTKNILVFSDNPRKDFAATFLANASLKSWMADNGEDEKLKAAVEEFSSNGNVGFKRVTGGYEFVDPLNTIFTNVTAETVDDTDIIERHEMSASQLIRMKEWNKEAVKATIKDCADKSFKSSFESAAVQSTSNKFEIFEFTGEVSEKEFNEANNIEEEADEHNYFLAKVIVSGLEEGGGGHRYTLYAEKLSGSMSDHFLFAHRGSYTKRFWRVGLYEILFDHQLRANEIGNNLARGLDWASRVIFRSSESDILQNIRADLENGDVIKSKDLQQVDVRLQGLDQLIVDWNRLMSDADRVANSFDVVRGENMPSGTPFRLGLMIDQNAGRFFVFVRQKLTLPYKKVFRKWIMPELLKAMKAKDIFQFVGETQILDQIREMAVESWYADNLVKIGPHSRETAEALKQEKLEEMKRVDPTIKNAKEIWDNVIPRLYVTITGENYLMNEQFQDLLNMIELEQDPERRDWILDALYKARGIPIPPKTQAAPAPQQPQATPNANIQMTEGMGAGQDGAPMMG
jgi:hypothetical protein